MFRRQGTYNMYIILLYSHDIYTPSQPRCIICGCGHGGRPCVMCILWCDMTIWVWYLYVDMCRSSVYNYSLLILFFINLSTTECIINCNFKPRGYVSGYFAVPLTMIRLSKRLQNSMEISQHLFGAQKIEKIQWFSILCAQWLFFCF